MSQNNSTDYGSDESEAIGICSSWLRDCNEHPSPLPMEHDHVWVGCFWEDFVFGFIRLRCPDLSVYKIPRGRRLPVLNWNNFPRIWLYWAPLNTSNQYSTHSHTHIRLTQYLIHKSELYMDSERCLCLHLIFKFIPIESIVMDLLMVMFSLYFSAFSLCSMGARRFV